MALAWKVSWEQSLKGSNPLSSARTWAIPHNLQEINIRAQNWKSSTVSEVPMPEVLRARIKSSFKKNVMRPSKRILRYLKTIQSFVTPVAPLILIKLCNYVIHP
jgi:hypothetical protein